jgi:Fe-S-cluster containining protein
MPKMPFDPKTREIDLDGGDCLKVLKTCQAMCCRGAFNIDISESEFLSGKYKAHPFCLLTGEICGNTKVSCANRKYRLEKKNDGSCIYLDESSMCSIHDHSPMACREFICTGG